MDIAAYDYAGGYYHCLFELSDALPPPKYLGRDRGHCDGCDDCDGIFNADAGVILIVTTVTNRHTVFLAKLMMLPLQVRFAVYSMPYSSRNFPALTLSLRVRILG